MGIAGGRGQHRVREKERTDMDGANVRRRFTGFAASLILITVGLLLNALPASAQVPPFTQCPPVGLDTSCAVLIVYNPDGSRATLVDPSQPPYDGVEDTLIGVQNNSTVSVSSLALSGPGIFGFDGDGLCATFTSPKPAGCPYGPTGYEGRGSTTPVASTASCGSCGNTFTVIDFNNGTVNFRVPIPPGGSAYFSLEGPTASVAPPLPPTKLTLTPLFQTNDVDTQHTVTATVTNAQGNPVPNIIVRFSVTGSVTASGQCTTNTSGQCSFTYTGPALPGVDAIHAFADTNNNGTQDATEPFGDATKAWTVPMSTPLCEVDITYGGWITANNGDRGSFGGNAKVDSQGNPQGGEEEYQDHGPAQPMDVHSIDVLAVVCTTSPPPKQASIFGTATIDGAGTYNYRIDLKDVDEPGTGVDTYRIRLGTVPLYDSGEHTLEGGNVQIHK
jgi:hypothetical protein